VPRARLRLGELIAAGGGAALLISLLLPWYTRDTEVAGVLFSERWTAWQSVPGTAIVLVGVGLAAIALPALRAFAAPRLRTDRLLTALGLLALALVAVRLVDIPLADIQTDPGDRADTGRGTGLLLGVVAGAAIAYGGRVRPTWPR
jgi:hypothetical protein